MPDPTTSAPPFDGAAVSSPLPIERLRILFQLTNAVSRAQDLSSIYEAALEGLLRAVSTDRASILLFDPDGVMRFKAWRGLSDRYRAAVEGHTPWNPDTVDAEPLLVPDVTDDADLAGYRPVFDAEGIRALGFIPLAYGGRLIGKFMIYFAEPHAFDDEEIRVATAIAGHVAFAVDRRRREEKLALYREIFAHSNEAIAIIGIDGTYLEQNAAHRALLGYDDAELVGRTPALHMGDERFAAVERALFEEGIAHEELSSRTRAGHARDIELSAFAVRDDAGQPVCFVGVKRDVTERKRTEQALTFLAAASAALDRSLDYDETLRALGALAVPFLADWALVETLDGEGRRVRAVGVHADASKSGALSRLAAIRAAEAAPDVEMTRRREPADLLPGSGPDAEREALLRELGARSVLEAPLRARGRRLGVLTVVSAREEYGDRELALIEDLARRAATALDNARLYGEAQESDRRKEEFLAVLAHELRNPLMPLFTCLELLRSEPGEAPAYRDVMERQVRNLKRLVDDLLDVSRVTRGKIELRKQTVTVSSVVARAVETTRPLLDANGLRLQVAVDPDARFEVDPLRLEQVLANLIGNACKYTARGGLVDVLGEREGSEIVLRVRDDGAGIAAETLPRVFDLFVQGERAAGGLGVGLTLVRTLVEMHGGSVRAASDGPGAGSTFTLRLPVGQLDAAARAVGATAMSAVRPLALLLVDDNADAVRVLADALRRRGHDVATAPDGRSALDAARQRPPDLVLLDLGLPDMEGYEVARRLREDPTLASVQIVALSGYDQERFRERSRTAGLEHVVKPVDLEQLDRIFAAHTAATRR